MNNEQDTQQHSGITYGTPLYGGSLYGATPSTEWNLLDPRRLLRKWRIVALVMLFAILSAFGYLWTATKTYRAASLIELSVRRPRIMTQQAAVIDDQASGQQSTEVFNTRLEKFKGRTMLTAALSRLDTAMPGVFDPPSPASSAAPDVLLERRLRQFESSITISLIRRSRLIRVEFRHSNPEVAAAACNAFAETAETSAYEENKTISDAAVAWLETQADMQRQKLLEAENALLAFRKKHQIDAIESQRKTVDEALREINMSLVEIESREALARTLLSRIDLLELNPENAAETPADIPRAEEIRTWLDRWRTALLERNSLLSTHTPKHPAVLAKDNLVALYRAETLDALKRAKTTAISNHALATEQAKALRMKKEEHIRMAAELEMKVVEGKTRLAALERSRDAADQAYRGVLARIQDARMAADENTATVKIVERATVPLQPFQPSPFRTLALALLLGLAGGLALITATDYLEDRVVGPEDLEGRGIPIMAVVPRVRNASRADIATATIRQHFSEVVEGFAGLGTMMDSPQHKEHSQIILVASSIPGEGKTVTSCNLAAILAKKGRRVLLVDFDLRRPRLAGIFPIPPSERPDMLPFQSDKTQLTKLPYTVAECPNLDVIASRPMIDRNPAMTLGTMAQHLVSWASSNYDHIVLDAPPLGLVSDTLALAPLADLTLVMARSGVSRKRLTWHTINRFWDSGIRNIALVINDFDISKRLYGGHSPYYHYQQHYKTYIPVGAGELKKGARQS